MAIFQFKCESCSAVFEHLVSSSSFADIVCVNCGAGKVARIEATYFYPNKVFCPHNKVLDKGELRDGLGGIMSNTAQHCGGCGSGSGCKGSCKSPSKLTLKI